MDFSKTNFREEDGNGKGMVSFGGAKFDGGRVYFSNAWFGEGDVSFRGAKFGGSTVDFSLTNFSCHAYFSTLKESSRISSISFRHCVFNQSLDLSDNDFECVPDLTKSRLMV